MKEAYTPAEADVLLISLPSLRAGDAVSTSVDPTPTVPGGNGGGIGGGGYDPGGWT